MKAGNKKRYDAVFKAKAALAAVQERETLAQLGARFGVHPVLVGQWKKLLQKGAQIVFERPGKRDESRVHDELLQKIG